MNVENQILSLIHKHNTRQIGRRNWHFIRRALRIKNLTQFCLVAQRYSLIRRTLKLQQI